MESVKKSIDKRAHHKREYDSRVNESRIQTTKEKVDTSKALDANIRPIYDEEPMVEPWFSSQVDVNNDLTKLVTTHYLPKERESAIAKPHHMIPPSSSRYSSNDIVYNHYLEKAKKKTQESDRNSRPSVMPSATSQSTANGRKPKSRSNTQTSRNWPASKNTQKDCAHSRTL
ncbi:hypothetical protein Tco_1108572 [Tanacetum coccineum]